MTPNGIRLIQGLAMVVSGTLAYLIRHATLAMPLRYGVAIAAGSLLMMGAQRLLSRFPRQSPSADLWRHAEAVASIAAILVTAAFALKVSTGFSRLWAVYWMASSWFFLAAIDAVWERYRAPRRIVVAGPAAFTEPIKARLTSGAVADMEFMPLPDLVRWLDRHETVDGLVDEIIVVGPVPDDAVRSALILALHGNPVDLRYCVDLGGLLPEGWANTPLGELTVPLAPIQPLRQRMIKRLEDLVLTLLALPVLLPVLAAIALMIRLDSPGPVLFRQRRLGLGGRAFTILKFRTMLDDASLQAEAPQARKGDDRITRLGHHLRRSGLDELPQIFNVLKGEMSLVGPRPHALPHDVQWSAAVAGYTRRFEMKPGITGLAQIKGCRGPVDLGRPIEDRLAMDMAYIASWSLALDLQIIIKTVRNRLAGDTPDL
ncbi:exopolysaccharide biosynthesis polyprenyl glycosylphosphotransferase [Magnetospirillum sp. 15-1]|uniref:exopolysaccharide biosynthesis polyprenyl glycosylphosphotransferase n=1 Tax=Magnetospirillum sp. 15-1 TaxID=1979370 RepID=UPI000BBCD1FC|nr:exopolysaccharide biosynthesis polyprenyl glycosylphosphotransferase [Magnetospirillum sp. 15-1]